MNAQDRVKKAHIDIMRHKTWCAVSGLLACGKTTIDKTITTACTNGWDVRYSPEFVDSLTEQELRFVVLHENAGHKAYKHLLMWHKLWEQNAKLANVAADHFVNLTLMDTDNGEGFIKMPKIGVQPEARFRGMSVAQIFRILEQEGDKGDKPEDGDGGGMDEHDWEGAGEHSEEQQAAQGKEIERAMRQGEILRKARSDGKGGSAGVFGDTLTPKVDWRKVLREFITETCSGTDESSWAKPNRRFLADDVYMPSMVGNKMTEMVIGFDTSGSCFNSAEMYRFVAEVTTIILDIKPSKCHVIYWDTEVAGHQTFEDGQFAVQNLKPMGGGGTDGSVLFDYLRDKRINPQAIVQFTDGYVGSWGQSDWPTLWAITTAGISAPFGTTIHIEV